MIIPDRDHAPIFVVGAQRSGTTMLRLMLNQHSQLAIPFESGFIVDFHRRVRVYGDLSKRDNARRLLADICEHPMIAKRGRWIVDHDEILRRSMTSYSDLVNSIFLNYARSHGKARWGDKTPGQETEIEVLWALFPNCKVIHLVRDGRDVAQSMGRVSWGIPSLPRAAADWRWKVTLGHKMGALLGQNFKEIKYEDLVLKPEATLRSLGDFIGLGFEPAQLRYHERALRELPKESVAWHRNSVTPPNPDLVYAWKHRMSIADRTIFEQIAGDALDLLGYERERRRSTLVSRAKNLYYANYSRW